MKLAVICGSFGESSTNGAALDVAVNYATGQGMQINPVVGLDQIPAFKPELVDNPPDTVVQYRSAIEIADGILLAAPEYAGGVAGAIKNALDWLVGSGSMYHKPVAVMSVGTSGGGYAIEQLVRTISWQGGLVVATLGVSAPRTKIDQSGRFTDSATLSDIESWTASLVDAVDSTPERLLAAVGPIVERYGIDPARFGDLKQ